MGAGPIFGPVIITVNTARRKAEWMWISVSPFIRQNLTICQIKQLIISRTTIQQPALHTFQKVGVYKRTENGQTFTMSFFLGATKHLYNWLCPLVGRSVTLFLCRTLLTYFVPVSFFFIQSIIQSKNLTDPAWLSCSLHAQSYGVVIVPGKCSRLVSRVEYCERIPCQQFPKNCVNAGNDDDDLCNVCKT